MAIPFLNFGDNQIEMTSLYYYAIPYFSFHVAVCVNFCLHGWTNLLCIIHIIECFKCCQPPSTQTVFFLLDRLPRIVVLRKTHFT